MLQAKTKILSSGTPVEAAAKTSILEIPGCHLNISLSFTDLLIVTLLWQFSCLLKRERERGLLLPNPQRI